MMVFVAIDEAGKSAPVPKWTPVTPLEQTLEERAARLVALGEQIQAELRAFEAP
jgi:acyl-CoA hydrolase